MALVKWQASAGEDRYRRSLYTFSKRTAPFAMYNTFDAPSGEACVARRDVSNSPLQALTLLNDTVFLEAAEALGKTIAAMDGTDEQKAAALFRRCLIRPPEKDEVDMLVELCPPAATAIAEPRVGRREDRRGGRTGESRGQERGD